MTMWVINTEEPVESPFTFRILPGAIKTIGRAPRADFIVDAALVSRVHCRLSAGAAELEVVDLDSTNGTFVNGARVERAVLKTGDRLGVGKVEFVVTRSQASKPASETNPDDQEIKRLGD
jgi:pSer/pThr/pTyr-binding forkhead associated (FHA) protein